MEQITAERLQDNLSRLKLTQAAEVLDTVAEQTKKKKSSYFAAHTGAVTLIQRFGSALNLNKQT